MDFACPYCGSRYLKNAHIRSLGEWFGGLLGRYPFRCGDCRHRFSLTIWGVDTVAYSRCPQCLRMDLSTWREEHFTASGWQRFRRMLGAHYYRCEYCRINFVSFRRRKEKFTFHRKAGVRS